ncbi:Guanine nucleotide-binding protein subunit gamma 3 [Linum grandiflorum]
MKGGEGGMEKNGVVAVVNLRSSSSSSGGSSSVTAVAAPPVSPKSPPSGSLDLYGKRRQLVKVQILEREIGLLQEELKAVEGLELASKCCKELHDFVDGKQDPLVPSKEEPHMHKPCLSLKRLCRSWFCCLCKCQCRVKPPKCIRCCACFSCLGRCRCCCCKRSSKPNSCSKSSSSCCCTGSSCWRKPKCKGSCFLGRWCCFVSPSCRICSCPKVNLCAGSGSCSCSCCCSCFSCIRSCFKTCCCL